MNGARPNLGANLIHIRTISQWPRRVFVRILGRHLGREERKALYALVSSVEHRKQRRSVLVVRLARLFDIPARALMSEDLTCETLDSLRIRFGFDPAEVERRAADFDY